MKKVMIAAAACALLGLLSVAQADQSKGEAIYKRVCFACHDSGAAGAPKRGDKAAWAPRIAKGVDALLQSALHGKNAMPPRGTCSDCTDADLRSVVEYLVSQAKGGASVAAAPAAQAKAEADPPAPQQAAADPADAGGMGNPAAGKTDAAVCAGCHGPDGNSLATMFPKLAGQHYDYLVKQLTDFKAGRRKNDIMSPMAANLTPQAIKDLAAYFSSQKIKPGQGKAKLAAAGEKLYRGGDLNSGLVACAGCHGPSGHGNPPAGFPALRSQQPDYIVKQLKDFRAGSRTNDPNGMMAGVTSKLSDDEIVKLAQFITDLK